MSVFFALIALLIVHFAYTATALFMGDVSQRKAQIIRTSSTALWITALPFACIMSFAFVLNQKSGQTVAVTGMLSGIFLVLLCFFALSNIHLHFKNAQYRRMAMYALAPYLVIIILWAVLLVDMLFPTLLP